VRSLTPRQKDCLDAIKAHRGRTGTMPTLEELRAAISAASRSDVHRLLKELEQRGAIRVERNVWRGIVVLDEKCPHCGEPLHESSEIAGAA
jgi:SOS-response transcriptional repressor LexA